MAGEGLSNCEAELKLSQINYLKLQNNFNVLQVKYIEEKENSFNLEKKIFYLENKEKEFNEKIKEIENKNIFLENKLKEKKEKIQKIKSDNKQKDEKINSLEEEIKKANDFLNKKFADLTNELEKLKNIIYIDLKFIKIENKWKEFVYFKCCENECIDTNYPIGNCIEGNGYVNLISDGNVKYIKCVEGKGVNNESKIVAENSFKKPQNCINNSLYYFEIKCMKMEGINKHNVIIGLKKCDCNKYTRFDAAKASILNEENKWFKVPLFSWKNNDVFGCGLVYPLEDFPYIFFTQNGKQIGKAVLIKVSNESFKPYILLNCCSVETNFGNNLEENPFIYDFSKHLFNKY